MKKVAIIGGSGYIGGHLVKALAHKFEVTALFKGIDLIANKIQGVSYLSVNDCKQTFDCVINTSYSVSNHKGIWQQENTNVCELIQRISSSHTQVIHLSSLAVFGFCLDTKIATEQVTNRADFPYVSSKIHMENLLLNSLSHSNLSIVRLGNVWGPANQSWTQPVADALTFGLPVLSEKNSFSNITFIHNITSYIQFIIEQNNHQLFHHLAEHSNISWQQLLNEVGEHLHKKPIRLTQISFYPKTISDEIQHATPLNPIEVLRSLKSGRFTANYFPAFVSRILSKLNKTTKTSKLPPFMFDSTFFWVLSCDKRFNNQILPEWNPPYNWEESNKLTLEWMDKVGYKTLS